jgi:hypothetical protein
MWVLTFTLLDCSEFGNFVITLTYILFIRYYFFQADKFSYTIFLKLNADLFPHFHFKIAVNYYLSNHQLTLIFKNYKFDSPSLQNVGILYSVKISTNS